MNAKCPDWRGRTVVVIASGPSLTREDCETARASGAVTIVTNSTWEMCPWADALLAFDNHYWHQQRPDGRLQHQAIFAEFPGMKFAFSRAVRHLGVQSLHGCAWFAGHGNSGTCAIWLALHARAARVILLGCDCQKTGGRAHWHPDHPGQLRNCATMPRWPALFAAAGHEANRRGIPVINASRETALACFPRMTIEEALK